MSKARHVAGTGQRSGRRKVRRGACEALGSGFGTMKELKDALKARDARRGYVPVREPMRFRRKANHLTPPKSP